MTRTDPAARSELTVAFTGTRKGLTPEQYTGLATVLTRLAGTRLVHGDAVGADAVADTLAHGLGYQTACYPGNIPGERAFCCSILLGRAKHPLDRNADIVKAGDVLVACPADATPQRRGPTWQAVSLAQAAGKPIVLIWPDGEIEETGGTPPVAS